MYFCVALNLEYQVMTPYVERKWWKKNYFHILMWQTQHNPYLPSAPLSDPLCTTSGQWGVTWSVWTSYPWLSRLQPECQDVEEGGGLIRSWSSCIWSLIGRRKPQKMFSKPSNISSPSSCWERGAVINAHTHINTHNGQLFPLWDTAYNGHGILDCKWLSWKGKKGDRKTGRLLKSRDTDASDEKQDTTFKKKETQAQS